MSELDNNTTQVIGEEYEPLMPDGWADGDDIFNSEAWSGSAETETETHSDADVPAGNDPTEEAAPAIEQSDTEVVDENGALEAELRAAAASHKFRFKTQYNHEDVDVELDESALPELYQKSRALDNVRDKLNKLSPAMKKAEELSRAMGYESVDAMLESAATTFRQNQIDELVADGVHKAVAADIIDRKLAAAKNADGGFSYDSSKGEPTQPESEPAEKKSGRDWGAEVSELMSKRPQLRGKELPKEVQDRAVKDGTTLLTAYLEYENDRNQAEITRLKKANKTHEQNAASAAHAPVTGVTGGGATDTSPSDPFMSGFDSYFN